MNKKDKIEFLIKDLSSVYCDTCSSYGLGEDSPDYYCDDCIRKRMNWGLSRSHAEYLVEEMAK